MAKKEAKAREAELRYAQKTRMRKTQRKKRTRGNTPWKTFFASGAGAKIETELPKTSIRAIVNTYGIRLGKRFSCSYQEQDDLTLVTIDAVRSRE
jgi:hypothetical protein